MKKTRKAFSIVIAALVWVAGIGAPFSHFHHGDSDHAHASSFSHAHLGHPVEHDDNHEGPSFDHPDDDTALWQDWSGELTAKFSVHLAILTDRFVVEPAISERRHAIPFILRTHDPPDLSNTSARAPPTV